MLNASKEILTSQIFQNFIDPIEDDTTRIVYES